MLKRNLKIDIVHVPFEGGGENVTALLGGHVDMSIVGLTPIQGQIASGKARLLAVSSPKRFPNMPQVPTLVEKGYMKSAIGTALGLAGPRGLSPAIVSQWDAAIQKTLQDQKIVSAVESLAGIVIDYQSGEAYKRICWTTMPSTRRLLRLGPNRRHRGRHIGLPRVRCSSAAGEGRMQDRIREAL